MDHSTEARRAGRNTIGDLVSRSADRYRDKVALRWGDAAWSYRELDAAASRAAAALLASGSRGGGCAVHASGGGGMRRDRDPGCAVDRGDCRRGGAAGRGGSDGEALVAHARQGLAPFKLPKRVFFAEALPKNTAGKLLKRALRQQYSGQAGAVMGLA